MGIFSSTNKNHSLLLMEEQIRIPICLHIFTSLTLNREKNSMSGKKYQSNVLNIKDTSGNILELLRNKVYSMAKKENF